MSTKEQGGLSRRLFLKGASVAAARCGRFRRAGRLLVGRRRVAGVAAEELGLRVRPLGHRLRGAGTWAASHRRRRVRTAGARAGEGPVRGGGNSSINNGEFAVIKDAEGMRQYWHEMTQDVDTPSAVIDAWIEGPAKLRIRRQVRT